MLILKVRKILTLIILCTVTKCAIAQEKSPVKFGKISLDDFSPYTGDTSYGAVIIADIGSTSFVGNKKGWFSHVFKRYTRIKILNQKAFALATQQLYLYKNGDNKEELIDISGAVYTNDNGKINDVRLDKRGVFEEQYSANFLAEKFTLAGVKAGAIIEYTYTIKSDFDFRLHPWEFQNMQYPCLWSEYQVAIPGLMVYAFARQGFNNFYINKAWVSHENYLVTEQTNSNYASNSRDLNVGTPTNNQRWVMKDIKPARIESHMSSPKNYIDKIEFQLNKVSDGETFKDVANNWDKMSEELLKDKDFGESLNETPDWLGNTINKVAADNDELQNAKNIYYYVRDNFICIHYPNYNDINIKTSLEDVFKKHSGNEGEINLLLILMLRQKGYTADPVMLSTRENGFNPGSYPILDRLNKVICKLQSGGKAYFLDASKRHAGFGFLTEGCYNGVARVINASHPDSVNLSTDSIKETKVVLINIINGENGTLDGTAGETHGIFQSFNMREAIGAQPGNAVKVLKEYCPAGLQVTDVTADSLTQPELPLKLNYNFTINTNKEENFYFNPFIGQFLEKNPFSANERMFPVQMPYCMQNVYIFNMEVPEGYKVVEVPKSIRLKLGETDGGFDYLIAVANGHIQLQCSIRLNKANFDPDFYDALRNFYADIIKKQSEQIVFKKL